MRWPGPDYGPWRHRRLRLPRMRIHCGDDQPERRVAPLDLGRQHARYFLAESFLVAIALAIRHADHQKRSSSVVTAAPALLPPACRATRCDSSPYGRSWESGITPWPFGQVRGPPAQALALMAERTEVPRVPTRRAAALPGSPRSCRWLGMTDGVVPQAPNGGWRRRRPPSRVFVSSTSGQHEFTDLRAYENPGNRIHSVGRTLRHAALRL